MHTQYSAAPSPVQQNRTNAAQIHQERSQPTSRNSSDAFQSNAGNKLPNEVLIQLLTLIVALIQSLIGAQQNTADESKSSDQETGNSGVQTAFDGAQGAEGADGAADPIMPLPIAEDDKVMNVDSDTSNDGSDSISSKQIFDTPVGADEAGVASPGEAYELTFSAKPDDKLSFATMLVQSNDLFFAPDEAGIPLFDAQGQPLEGDITDKIEIWDAGTEQDEVAGEGANQAPRQADSDTGAADPDNRVRAVDPSSAGFPEVNEQIKATIDYLGNNEFKLTLSNISDSSALPTPITPGVAVVHSEPAPIFTNLQADRGLGLEALAEDGDPAMLFANL